MSSTTCPKCGKEMEEVVGFSGYVWCRDCHITKKIEDRYDEDRREEENIRPSSRELKP